MADNLLDLDPCGPVTADTSTTAAPAPAASAASSDVRQLAEPNLDIFDSPPAATSVTAAAATPPSALPVVAPAAAAATDDDAFADFDGWDAFQSAAPETSGAGDLSLLGGVSDQKAETTSNSTTASATPSAAPSQTSAADPLMGGFDPMEIPKASDPQTSGGVLSSTDLDALDQKIEVQGAENSSNLINLVDVDDFDPVGVGQTQENKQEAAEDVAHQGAEAAAPLQQQTTAQAAPVQQELVFSPTPVAPPAAAAKQELTIGQTQAAKGVAKAAAPQADLLGFDGDEIPGAVPTIHESGLDCDVEDDAKRCIKVFHKGEKHIVGWYADVSVSDMKQAVFLACDAIMDGGFVLREVQFSGDDEQTAEAKEDGRKYDWENLEELISGHTYILEAAKEREDAEVKEFTGGPERRWRRLKIAVEPLLHVEAQKAIERMRKGSNLLKHTHYGFPHLRQFQLSDDRKRLVWYSGAKRKDDSVVQLDEVTEIKLGQTTPVFLHYRLPMLEHLSFSLIHGKGGSKTLDLTCKDEFEFDHWVTGLKAIIYHFKNKQISKEYLLAHSKRFKKAMEKNNTNIKLTKLPEVKEKGHVGLDDCIEIVSHTPQQLDTKLDRLKERLRTMSQQVARLDHHSMAETEVDLSLLTGQGPAYASVFVHDEDAQDEEMEIRRMHELVEQTTQLLQQARQELIALNSKNKPEASTSASSSTAGGDTSAAQTAESKAKGKKKENAACKHVDQLLWKAEVDLENVEDMYLRHIDNQRDTTTPFSVSMADLNSKLSRSISDMQDSVDSQLTTMRTWFR